MKLHDSDGISAQVTLSKGSSEEDVTFISKEIHLVSIDESTLVLNVYGPEGLQINLTFNKNKGEI